MSLRTFAARTFAGRTWLAVRGAAQGDPLSVHYRCLLAAQAKIRSLGMPGIDPASVIVSKTPWVDRWVNPELGYAFPLVFICPDMSETMPPADGTNRADDVGYACLVVFVQSPDNSQTDNLNRYLLWREQVHRALRNRPLGVVQSSIAVPEIITCRVEPRSVLVGEEFVRGVWQSATLLRFISREPRG